MIRCITNTTQRFLLVPTQHIFPFLIVLSLHLQENLITNRTIYHQTPNTWAPNWTRNSPLSAKETLQKYQRTSPPSDGLLVCARYFCRPSHCWISTANLIMFEGVFFNMSGKVSSIPWWDPAVASGADAPASPSRFLLLSSIKPVSKVIPIILISQKPNGYRLMGPNMIFDHIEFSKTLWIEPNMGF